MVKVLRNYGDLVIINSFASEHQEPWFMMGRRRRGYMLHPMQVQDYCTRALQDLVYASFRMPMARQNSQTVQMG
jgi:hypothetical protein